MAMYGCVGLCMAMAMYDNAWVCRANVRLCMAVQGCSAFKLDSSFLFEWSEPFL